MPIGFQLVVAISIYCVSGLVVAQTTSPNMPPPPPPPPPPQPAEVTTTPSTPGLPPPPPPAVTTAAPVTAPVSLPAENLQPMSPQPMATVNSKNVQATPAPAVVPEPATVETPTQAIDVPMPPQEQWHIPTTTDKQPYVPEIQAPPQPKPKKYYLQLGMDLYFHSESMNSADMSGAGSNWVLRFGGAVGTSIGVVGPGGHFYMSFDMGRKSGKQLVEKNGIALWLTTPTLSAQMILLDGFSHFSFGPKSDIIGLRLTRCAPVPVVIDLRALNVQLFTSLGENGNSENIAVALGFSLNGGILF
ncbi:MAG: hypothetical protein JXX29_10075 [Deltaproteobacteria bacterium]|nr:hypothetical protein [Deltaproteobacteria bacterium]